jgi:uncharacterized protein YecE (DUF72 family)
MDFGRIQTVDLARVDFTLPIDTALTLNTLSKVEPKPFEVHIGGTQWGVKEWQGPIYPKKVEGRKYLQEYVKHFNGIELGATFYTMPTVDQLLSWKQQAESNKSFKFCPKFPQSITHIRRLSNADGLTTQFYNVIRNLGNNLGPILLQLSDAFTPKSYDNLESFVAKLPTDLKVFVELRHKEWFANHAINVKVFDLFSQLGIGAAISDAAGRRDCVHMNLTTPDAYIRFVGNGLLHDKKRLDDWVNRIAKWSKLGLQNVWFMMHQYNERETPLAINYLAKELNDKLGLSIQTPRFLSEIDLFS